MRPLNASQIPLHRFSRRNEMPSGPAALSPDEHSVGGEPIAMSNGPWTPTPPSAQEERESLVDVRNHNVRLGPDLQVNDQLSIGLRKSEASRFSASPQQAMTELVAIKGNRRIKIGDAEQVIVGFSKQGSFRAHVDETPTELTHTDYARCVLTDIYGMPQLELKRACS
jgi:hypothetical protein